MCQITLEKPTSVDLKGDDHTCLIAQRFPTFGGVSLRNKCVLTCDEQKGGLGGILAFEANSLLIDETSKIDMSGKGRSKICCGRFKQSGAHQAFCFSFVHCIELIIRSCQLEFNQKENASTFQDLLGVTGATNEEVEVTVAKRSFVHCNNQLWVKVATFITRPGQRTRMESEEEGLGTDQVEEQVSRAVFMSAFRISMRLHVTNIRGKTAQIIKFM